MLARILSNFPAYTHALTLVSDPDNVLADEEVLAALAERGFVLISEPDPVRLRYRIEQARPFRAERPLIIVTPGPLNELPYDLWQQGHLVTLALHSFFPSLAYPVVRALTPTQRSRLSQMPAPPRPLGRKRTMEFLWQHVFDASLDRLRHPAGLIEWLNRYHQLPDPMPQALAEALLARLRAVPAYTGWPLAELLGERDFFARFVREQWSAFVGQETDQVLNESPVDYILRFETDDDLQDSLASLMRTGTLPPVCVKEPERLPRWARSAVVKEDEDRAPRRIAELLELLSERLSGSLTDMRWEEWQAIARTWAELNALLHAGRSSLTTDQTVVCKQAEAKLDAAFLEWLRGRYAPLGAQRLPVPHHLHHVPHYIAFQRRQGGVGRCALLVMDGMSLADWHLIGSAWRARHPDWRLEERLLLAQIPTITAVSRQALISGLRPADLTETLADNRSEPRLWEEFWAQQEIAAKACPYARLALERGDAPVEITSARTRAICLIDSSIDEMLHGASLGAADVQASLQVWLDEYSARLEELVELLLEREFTLFVTSDHGHVEARGMGQPSEGVTVQTRCKRARVYDDRLAAIRVQQGFPRTILWEADGLLPEGVSALVPEDRLAFALSGEVVVTHGGVTLEEVVVPLVTITSRGEVDNG